MLLPRLLVALYAEDILFLIPIHWSPRAIERFIDHLLLCNQRFRHLAIERPIENKMLHQHAVKLADAVKAIFRLNNISRYPIKLNKNNMRRSRKRKPNTHRRNVANYVPTRWIVLKFVYKPLPFFNWCFSSYDHDAPEIKIRSLRFAVSISSS